MANNEVAYIYIYIGVCWTWYFLHFNHFEGNAIEITTEAKFYKNVLVDLENMGLRGPDSNNHQGKL